MKLHAKGRNKAQIVRYAEDFIITSDNKAFRENEIKPIVEQFLHERGLELSAVKTKITDILDGFEFLGFNIRKYGRKLLIKPSKENGKTFQIRGWANYYQHVVAWRYKKYFRTQGNNRWIFHTITRDKSGNIKPLDLIKASQKPIKQHLKVQVQANPFDSKYEEYFRKREEMKSKSKYR